MMSQVGTQHTGSNNFQLPSLSGPTFCNPIDDNVLLRDLKLTVRVIFCSDYFFQGID
jgi:hypothetical protein